MNNFFQHHLDFKKESAELESKHNKENLDLSLKFEDLDYSFIKKYIQQNITHRNTNFLSDEDKLSASEIKSSIITSYRNKGCYNSPSDLICVGYNDLNEEEKKDINDGYYEYLKSSNHINIILDKKYTFGTLCDRNDIFIEKIDFENDVVYIILRTMFKSGMTKEYFSEDNYYFKMSLSELDFFHKNNLDFNLNKELPIYLQYPELDMYLGSITTPGSIKASELLINYLSEDRKKLVDK